MSFPPHPFHARVICCYSCGRGHDYILPTYPSAMDQTRQPEFGRAGYSGPPNRSAQQQNVSPPPNSAYVNPRPVDLANKQFQMVFGNGVYTTLMMLDRQPGYHIRTVSFRPYLPPRPRRLEYV